MPLMAQIRSTLPYIRTDIPVVVIFRALGLHADKDIIEHIVYDFEDAEMMERFRPSLEEASPSAIKLWHSTTSVREAAP